MAKRRLKRARILEAYCRLCDREIAFQCDIRQLLNKSLISVLVGFGLLFTWVATDVPGWFVGACIAASVGLLFAVLASRVETRKERAGRLATDILLWLLTERHKDENP